MERYDINDHDYHIFPLPRTPFLQGQSWSFISYLSIAQNPFATGTVVVVYIISKGVLGNGKI
jgi:hypothetical protein